MRSARSFIAALVASSLMGMLTTHPAEARAAQPGFAISAVDTDSYFRYRVRAGQPRRGTIRLVNLSRRSLTVLVRAADVTTAATGGLEYGSAPPSGDGRWLKLDRSRVRLPGRGARNVGFRVRVPPTATPGDHFAGIVALNQRDVRTTRRRRSRRRLQLRFLPRLAIAVQATLPGGHARELRPGNAGVEVTPSATNATLLVRNTGDRLINGTSGDLTLLQGATPLVRHRVSLDSFVPDTQITLRVPFKGTPARGTYTLRGTLRPKGGEPVRVDETIRFGDRAVSELHRETGREAKDGSVPVLILTVLGAALLLLVATVAALLRRQRRLIAELADARREPHSNSEDMSAEPGGSRDVKTAGSWPPRA